MWRSHLDGIRATWDSTMASWVDPSRLPPIDGVIEEVARLLRSLRLD